jgi:hypothetical protein
VKCYVEMSNVMMLANEKFPVTAEQRSLFDETMKSIALEPIDSKARSAIALSKHPWLARLSCSQTRAFPNELVFDWYRITPFKNLDLMVVRVLPFRFFKQILAGVISISHNADHDRVAHLGTSLKKLADRFYRPWA